MQWDDLYHEMTGHLRNLIAINTTNPPGNEIAAARYIRDVYQREGIDSLILEPAEGRGSLVARLHGSGARRPLLLMSHLDVVEADEAEWEYPPFAGTVAEEYLWGRGALDCKNTVVLWMMILIMMKRFDISHQRDVIFLGAADEEAGGRFGAEWIVKNRFDLVDAEAALNEGGGLALGLLGKTYYTCQSGEKGNLWLRVTARGRSGHGSVPREDNPVEALAGLLVRLRRTKSPLRFSRTVKGMFDVIAADQPFHRSAVLRLMRWPFFAGMVLRAAPDREKAAVLGAMLRNTLSLTVLRAGSKVNVIPSEASAELDFRLLPGCDVEEFYRDVLKVIGGGFHVEILDRRPATESPVEHPMVDSIRRVVREHHPGSEVLPLLLPAVSDGSFFREKGMAVYGFTPLLPGEEIDRIHGRNERISLESLRFSLRVGWDVVRDFIS